MYIDQLKKDIKEIKPNISDNSIDLYIRNIRILYNKIHNGSLESLVWLDDFEGVIDLINESYKTITTRRNYINSILSVLNTTDAEVLPLYEGYYKQITNEYIIQNNSQKRSNKEKENWIDMPTLKEIKLNYKKKYDEIIKKDKINNKEFDLLQRYIVCMLYIGSINNPPLRLDYAETKVRFIDEYQDSDKSNILVVKPKSMFLHLSNYKTKSRYGVKKINISPPVYKVLTEWLRYNTTGFLLVNANKTPMNNNGLTKYLNKVFEESGKKISVTMLRHIYLSDKFPADLKKRQLTADRMAHSIPTQMNYSKFQD